MAYTRYDISKTYTRLCNSSNTVEGETLEQKIERILHDGEPIKDSAPIIYQERKEGVRPEYDIRTDTHDIAIEAADKVTAGILKQREDRGAVKKADADKGDATGKSTQGKSTDSDTKGKSGATPEK